MSCANADTPQKTRHASIASVLRFSILDIEHLPCFVFWLVKLVPSLLSRSRRVGSLFRYHVATRSQFIRASHRDFISFMQTAKDLDGLAVDFAGLHVQPFRVSNTNANDKRRL